MFMCYDIRQNFFQARSITTYVTNFEYNGMKKLLLFLPMHNKQLVILCDVSVVYCLARYFSKYDVNREIIFHFFLKICTLEFCFTSYQYFCYPSYQARKVVLEVGLHQCCNGQNPNPQPLDRQPDALTIGLPSLYNVIKSNTSTKIHKLATNIHNKLATKNAVLIIFQLPL